MPSKMMQSTQVDDTEWPVLVNSKQQTEAKQESPEPEQDWELLVPEESSGSTGNEKAQQNLVLVETDLRSRPVLKHCASSPNLHHADLLESVIEEDDASDSYAMVSGPKSVVSVSSTFSFRDAILSRPSSADSKEDQEQSTTNATTSPQRRTIKPKFVVKAVAKPMRRCSKSTGDLRSLVMIHEDEEVMGESDAMDFYHRKAQGAKNRSSGLKLRPDEAKRKQMTIHKKTLQRNANANR